MNRTPGIRRSVQQGLTLIELMIGLLIGMVLALAVTVVMITAEGRKRTIMSSNDMQQASNYVTHLLDHWVRNAGNGFSRSAGYAYGCRLMAYYSGAQILPTVSNAALPSPFASVSAGTVGEFRLAPLLILPDQTTPGVSGQTSDVLVVMGGAAGLGGVPLQFSSFADAAQLNLTSTVAAQANDLLLVTQVEPSTSANYSSSGSAISSVNTADCIVEQAASSFTPGGSSLVLSGTYHSANNGLSSLSDNSTVSVIGNVSASRPPQFLVLGVGGDNTLFSYDLLRTNGSSSAVARANGIFELRALYGIDKNCDGTIGSGEWVKPTDTTYSVSALMAGSMQEQVNRPTDATVRLSSCASLTTANDYLQKILAVRIGLILRTSLPEKEVVTTGPLTLFSDLGSALTYTRTLKSDTADATRLEQHYRYQTTEITIPLRNPLMLP